MLTLLYVPGLVNACPAALERFPHRVEPRCRRSQPRCQLRLRLDILNGNQVVPKALGLSAVAVAGTVAASKVQPLASGDIIRFQALIRMNLPAILGEVGPTAAETPLPVEFVLLDLE